MNNLFKIRNLSVGFETAFGLLPAVNSLDLTVSNSEVLAIVGESGSGKSVAMLAIMGLLPWVAKITADEVSFGGHDLLSITARERRKIIGTDITMIFQEPLTSLNPCFTIGYQIAEAIKQPLRRKEKSARVIELLDAVGIPSPEKRLHAFPHQLSGGMNQRVVIAMALAPNPKLIIADEPTTALDVTVQAQILDLLLSLQRQTGMGLILITHDMGVVAQMAERVVVMYAGQMVEQQAVRRLFDNPVHPYTHALLEALPERAVAHHLPSIPGTVPGVLERPKGCLFSPRCRFATEKCTLTPPTRASKEFGHVLCNYPLVNGVPQGYPAQLREG